MKLKRVVVAKRVLRKIKKNDKLKNEDKFSLSAIENCYLIQIINVSDSLEEAGHALASYEVVALRSLHT